MFEKIIEISMLFDFYGQLLTEKQQEILRLYHENDYSLSEIADEFSISRQGVHDTVKKAEKALHQYENKLGLIGKLIDTKDRIDKIDLKINQLITENKDNQELTKKLGEIKAIIDNMDQ